MADEEEEKDRQLDAMLDAWLRSYSAADPRPGYETRLRAVVKVRIARVRRANWLMIAASAAAAVVLFGWMMLTRTRNTEANPDRVAVNQLGPSVPGRVVPEVKGTPVTVEPAIGFRAGDRGSKVGKSDESRLVLEMAEAARGTNMVFEHEKLYLTPEILPEPAATTPAADQDQDQTQVQADTPNLSIRDVGVASIESNAPIEIKDLAPPKSSNEKGSL